MTDTFHETATARRRFLRALGTAGTAGTVALAGCASGGSGGDGEGDGAYDGWLQNVDGFDGEPADRTGQSEATVQVGAGNGFSFDPPAVRVSVGTTVVWEWTGQGSRHNVVAESGNYESPYYSASGETFEHTFEAASVSTYFCVPHRNAGMKGVVEVVEE